jgi:hypothetical protein
MSERNCLKCRHCVIDPGEPNWSEVTPGSDPEMRCGKGHWFLRPFEYDRKDVLKAFEMAKTCPDYEEET